MYGPCEQGCMRGAEGEKWLSMHYYVSFWAFPLGVCRNRGGSKAAARLMEEPMRTGWKSAHSFVLCVCLLICWAHWKPRQQRERDSFVAEE